MDWTAVLNPKERGGCENVKEQCLHGAEREIDRPGDSVLIEGKCRSQLMGELPSGSCVESLMS